MDWKLGGIVVAVSLCGSMPSLAQDYSGFSDAAAAVAGRKDRDEAIHRDRVLDDLAAYGAMERARRSRDEAVAAEIQADVQVQLKQFWIEVGLPAEEASVLAASYEFTAEQLAHNLRARQDGVGPTVHAALAAYQQRDYRLANQLLVAATRKDVPGVK